jgi:hypothetical protein
VARQRFVAIEGDPRTRPSGTMARAGSLRDYAEVGASRKFTLAENAFLKHRRACTAPRTTSRFPSASSASPI